MQTPLTTKVTTLAPICYELLKQIMPGSAGEEHEGFKKKDAGCAPLKKEERRKSFRELRVLGGSGFLALEESQYHCTDADKANVWQ